MTNTKIGYARVSTMDQDTGIQVQALRDAGCDTIRTEKASGTSTNGRPELASILEFIREGDALVVTRIDRLARSIGDLQVIVKTLRDKGAALVCTEQPVDTGTAAGKAFLDMLGVFAEFETNLRRERQMEGIEKAKARGVYKGRKRSIDRDEVHRLRSEGLGPTEIAQRMGVGRASVYRVIRDGAQGSCLSDSEGRVVVISEPGGPMVGDARWAHPGLPGVMECGCVLTGCLVMGFCSPIGE
jgi:DNA invertase Pin-like site-specific DNA recombinase